MKKTKDEQPKALPETIPPNPLPRRKAWADREVEVALTDEEKAKLSKQLVESLESLEDAEERKAEVVAQFSGEIKTYKAAYKSLVRAIRRGFVMRTVKCKWTFNKPKNGFKQLVNPDSDKVIETVAMSEFEKQEPLFPDDEEKANAKDEKPNDDKTKDKPALVSAEKVPVN